MAGQGVGATFEMESMIAIPDCRTKCQMWYDVAVRRVASKNVTVAGRRAGLGRNRRLAQKPGRVTYPPFGRACPRLEAASLAPRLPP